MKRSSHLVREIIETLALTLIIFVVIHFTVQNYVVDGTSMQPSLTNNQYVLVNKLAYVFHAPERGDVIVFHWPLDTTKDLIKRVIGIPGDVGKAVLVYWPVNSWQLINTYPSVFSMIKVTHH